MKGHVLSQEEKINNYSNIVELSKTLLKNHWFLKIVWKHPQRKCRFKFVHKVVKQWGLNLYIEIY